ncbi:MAG: cysteine--tRNA ligase [Fibrobacteria bacterium]|nr:cysteine--tRNA ligase [Fibrobacteria bacterium]
MNFKPLSLYNTASKSKQEFQSLTPGIVKMYCCGPTVYNYAHIGNLRTYIFEDFLRRALEYAGYTVQHAVNITDVGHLTSDADTGEDKLEKGAKREGKSVWDIAALYTEEFMRDWERLNLLDPTVWPKATDHIKEQITLVQTLEGKGFTYKIDDGIYFDTSKFPRYGEFAGLDIENQEAGIRVAMAEGKKNPTDFALWKFSPKDVKRAMEWDSPWGVGFPGWHIECSAMAMKHLGETLDIHCGGADHVRVHHTNEIAQSECATGKPFATFWLHGGWLLESKEEGGGKMSKSKDEFVRLQTLINKHYDPLDYRYFCMTSHYRNYLSFGWSNLKSAKEGLTSLRKKTAPLINQVTSIESDLAHEWRDQFTSAICDDLNLPQALGIVNKMLKDINLMEGEKGALLLDFDQVLGLDLGKSDAPAKESFDTLDRELSSLLQERNEARKSKNFARADEIRDLFKEKGYVIKDGPEGAVLEKIQ